MARVTEANVHLAANTFTWLLEEYKEYQPCVAVIEDDQFVSICHSPYISPKAHIAGVDTLEGYRRRGYATAVASENLMFREPERSFCSSFFLFTGFSY